MSESEVGWIRQAIRPWMIAILVVLVAALLLAERTDTPTTTINGEDIALTRPGLTGIFSPSKGGAPSLGVSSIPKKSGLGAGVSESQVRQITDQQVAGGLASRPSVAGAVPLGNAKLVGPQTLGVVRRASAAGAGGGSLSSSIGSLRGAPVPGGLVYAQIDVAALIRAIVCPILLRLAAAFPFFAAVFRPLLAAFGCAVPSGI